MQRADAEAIKRNKPDLSPNSVITYVAHIKRVRIHAPELSGKKVLKYLDGLKPHIANQLISAVVARYPRFRQHVTRYRKLAEKYRDENAQKGTEKQRENWTSIASIKRAVRLMRRELKQFGFTRDSRLTMAFLSWSIMLEHTMRNDLPSLKIAETSKDAGGPENYYVVSLGQIWLNKFKTAKAFKRRGLLPLKLQLKKPLKLLIMRYLRSRKDSNFLISQPDGRPFSKSAFRNLLLNSSKKYLGVKIGSTQMRHIVLSEFLAKDPSLLQRKSMARSMQQIKLETQLSYQIRDIDQIAR